MAQASVNKKLETLRWESFAPAASYQPGEWHTVADLWTVDSLVAGADHLEFAVVGGNQMIVLDNVSITKITGTGRRNLRAD